MLSIEFFFLFSRAEFLHVKPGKGAAFVRTKIRNYVNGSTVERTFRAGISVKFLPFFFLLVS